MFSGPSENGSRSSVRSSDVENSVKKDNSPGFVIDTFDQWANSSDATVAPTVCSCFRH